MVGLLITNMVCWKDLDTSLSWSKHYVLSVLFEGTLSLIGLVKIGGWKGDGRV